MEIKSSTKMNCLYWITSLHGCEQGVTRRILEDLQTLADQLQLPLVPFYPVSSSEFLAALDTIIADAGAGMLPMIHLDTHGSKRGDIQIAATGEQVPWESVISKFRIINQIVGNNLCVVSCACFSFQFVKAININQVSPFFMLLAPENEIQAGEIEDRIIGFYRAAFDSADILAAQKIWLSNQIRIFHCEQMLAILLARYINDSAMGKQKDRRKEALITAAFKSKVARNRRNLRAARKLVASALAPTEALLDRFVPTFLSGKKPSFTIAELKVFVREQRAKGLKPTGPYA